MAERADPLRAERDRRGTRAPTRQADRPRPQQERPQEVHPPDLQRDLRASLQSRFQHDFASVRVHSDARAAELAATAGALAVTRGDEIFFGAGQFDPRTSDGVDLAYTPMLISETTAEWLEIDDVEQSRQFLESNAEHRVTPEALDGVSRRDDAVRHAVLTLTRAGDTDLALRLLLSPEQIPAALERAGRTDAAEKLAAITQIAQAYADTDEQAASAGLHAAIALAIAGKEDESIEIIKQIRRIDSDPAPLTESSATPSPTGRITRWRSQRR